MKMKTKKAGSVNCPSVFGEYPSIGNNSAWVDVSSGGKPVNVDVLGTYWESGRFEAEIKLHGSAGGSVELVVKGGASTPGALAQNILSQCITLPEMPGDIRDLVQSQALTDFLFDQVAPDEMKGMCRQREGANGSPWLTASDIQQEASRCESISHLLGMILKHPAAHSAHIWNSSSPLEGLATRVEPTLTGRLISGSEHFLHSGCLVIGDGMPNEKELVGIELPKYGWIVTGKRAGVESFARTKAEKEERPLIVVSRQDEAEAILKPNHFGTVILDNKGKRFGSFRRWMLDRVQDQTMLLRTSTIHSQQ